MAIRYNSAGLTASLLADLSAAAGTGDSIVVERGNQDYTDAASGITGDLVDVKVMPAYTGRFYWDTPLVLDIETLNLLFGGLYAGINIANGITATKLYIAPVNSGAQIKLGAAGAAVATDLTIERGSVFVSDALQAVGVYASGNCHVEAALGGLAGTLFEAVGGASMLVRRDCAALRASGTGTRMVVNHASVTPSGNVEVGDGAKLVYSGGTIGGEIVARGRCEVDFTAATRDITITGGWDVHGDLTIKKPPKGITVTMPTAAEIRGGGVRMVEFGSGVGGLV